MKPSSVPFLALCFGLLTGAVVSTSCGPSRPACTPSSCNGCCDSTSGLCVSITTSTQCGTRGETCKACSLGQSCSFGACTGGNTGAGQSGTGGGFSTTGGGLATGGGTGGGFATGGGFVTGGGAAGGFATGGGFTTGGGTGGGFTTGGGTAGGGATSCSTANCSSGCCQGTTCVLPPSNALNGSCGFGGFTCTNCVALGQVCNTVTFSCTPGSGGGSAGGGAGGGTTTLGDDCTSPIPLTFFSGTASTSGSLTGLLNDSSACSGTGPDAVYQVTLASPAFLTAQVSASGFTPRVSVRSFCTNTSTLACDSAPISGTATATTSQLGAGTYFVWVDSSSSTASGSYSLSITSTGSGGGGAGGGFGGGGTGGGFGGGGGSGTYSVSSITASCDTVTSGFQELDAITDDGATLGQSLPFAVPFFGVPMFGYAVASNGLLQLGPTTSISTVTSGSNASSFATTPVVNAVAPFWDDLENSSTADVRSTSLGSGSTQRFVVEWKDFAFYSSGGPTSERLRFQAKLFANGTIEFHYCSMVGSLTRHTGDSATIGIGTGSATQEIMRSVNTASVSTGAGFRFTP